MAVVYRRGEGGFYVFGEAVFVLVANVGVCHRDGENLERDGVDGLFAGSHSVTRFVYDGAGEQELPAHAFLDDGRTILGKAYGEFPDVQRIVVNPCVRHVDWCWHGVVAVIEL